MTTISIRTREHCPYLPTCRYGNVCRYTAAQVRQIRTRMGSGELSVRLAQGMAGAACVALGLMLTVTLLLLPIGLPLAVLGLALVMSAAEMSEPT